MQNENTKEVTNENESKFKERAEQLNQSMLPFHEELEAWAKQNNVTFPEVKYGKFGDKIFKIPVAMGVPICLNTSTGKVEKINIYVNADGNLILENIGTVYSELLGEELQLVEVTEK
jgi:Cys-tRNA synthase (O-phospho-L-seryl-tRNA:Cys-tRNA synthase)